MILFLFRSRIFAETIFRCRCERFFQPRGIAVHFALDRHLCSCRSAMRQKKTRNFSKNHDTVIDDLDYRSTKNFFLRRLFTYRTRSPFITILFQINSMIAKKNFIDSGTGASPPRVVTRETATSPIRFEPPFRAIFNGSFDRSSALRSGTSRRERDLIEKER